MFLIKRVGDRRLAQRICGSFGVPEDALVYGAFKDGEVLATAVFLEEDDCLVLQDVDTGRRMDVDLVDGLARAAWNAGRRTGIKRARLGDKLPQELRLALTKRGYALDGSFDLGEFFQKKHCGKG